METTLYGRRRSLPELNSTQFQRARSGAERMALNTPIQGTAADIIKLAMIRVRNRMQQEHLSARLVLQVHDELIVECPEQEAEAVMQLITEEIDLRRPAQGAPGGRRPHGPQLVRGKGINTTIAAYSISGVCGVALKKNPIKSQNNA